jgi:hypothetical protein
VSANVRLLLILLTAAVVMSLLLVGWGFRGGPPDITSPGPTWRSCAALRDLIPTASNSQQRSNLEFAYWRYCRDKSAFEQEQERYERSTEP